MKSLLPKTEILLKLLCVSEKTPWCVNLCRAEAVNAAWLSSSSPGGLPSSGVETGPLPPESFS